MPNGINVFLMSGYNAVSISGGISSNVSGQTVYLVNDGLNNIANVSGFTVRIGGTGSTNPVAVAAANADSHAVGNISLFTNSFMMGFHDTNGTWARARVSTPVSGDGYKLMATISGDAV